METKIDFVYTSNVDADLKCKICFNPVVDPIVEPSCGQMFCRSCFTNWLKKNTSCPNCKNTTLVEYMSSPPLTIITKLDSLQVRCPACSKHFDRKSFTIHYADCCKVKSEEIVSCKATGLGCQWKGPLRDTHEHTNECYYVKNHIVLNTMNKLETKMNKLEDTLNAIIDNQALILSCMQRIDNNCLNKMNANNLNRYLSRCQCGRIVRDSCKCGLPTKGSLSLN